MNGFNIFFNTKVENSGILTWMGDTGLAPFRYLVRGKTLLIEREGLSIAIHHVMSFHAQGQAHASKTSWRLRSYGKGWVKAACSVALLPPGLLIGAAFKGMAYLMFPSIREKHRLVKEHFRPMIRIIGENGPVTGIQDLKIKLGDVDPKNCRTEVLIIYGQDLHINTTAEIYRLNPKKLILVGMNVRYQPKEKCLDTGLDPTRKWALAGDSLQVREVDSIASALVAEPARRPDGGFYHEVYKVVDPHPVDEDVE